MKNILMNFLDQGAIASLCSSVSSTLMSRLNRKRAPEISVSSKKKAAIGTAMFCAAALCATAANAQTLSSNSVGTHDGFYYSFWKDSGSATMTLQSGGRYQSQWDNSTNNWVGGKGWNPGNNSKVINYSGYYGGSNSQNTYLALYGWTKSPLIEYYVIESYGSYNPSSCAGGTDYGSFQSDGATYNVRRCQRVNKPSIEGDNSTFYQYFSVRSPKKAFGNISGTITFANHANFWASKGLNLGNHDYMVLATEGYQSSGNSDITVSEGSGNGGGGNDGGNDGGNGGDNGGGDAGGGNTGDIIVRARGTTGEERISLNVASATVASWTLSTSHQNYTYSGGASGDIQVEFTNDGGSRDVILDYIQVNGETRQAEDMDYNTATYGNGECGGGSNSETMHCGGVIGFGYTYDCFSGNCSGSTDGGGDGGNDGGNTGGGDNGGGNTSCSGYVGITFDDGPGSNTAALISLLNQHDLTPVTWFNQGNYVAGNSNLMSQQLTVGEVHNHSYTHPRMTNYSYQQVYDEMNRTNQAIQNAGAPKPTLYRPPYGEVNSTIQQAAQALGLRVVTWDVDSEDWNGASASAIANKANQLQNGQIILMHDGNYTNTNQAIAQIASNLRAKGLCPGRIDPNTGRAVAPSASNGGNDGGNTGGGDGGNDGGNTGGNDDGNTGGDNGGNDGGNGGNDGGNTSGQCQCNWWGTLYPTCQSQTTGWGWENSQSCISDSTCSSQGAGGGGLVCN
jgi:peptidoglycan/xylan/chitin deacetylase (PgdA/CDA1 family)